MLFLRPCHHPAAEARVQGHRPGVPNRSLLGEAAYAASVARNVDGPVVLVGHSYGGAVITMAGTEGNVKALVYLSGYALEEGRKPG
ncbi:Alpha/beta hydrolase family protein [Streptomyces sp. ADI92-24]|nr:Alpha/beta hydrolase family protein [Streptomyces sp. ADI92-24]